MAKFAWEGVTKSGQKMKGEMEASDEAAVQAQLRRQGISPEKVKERGKGLDIEIKIPGMEPKVQTKDLVVFTRQFSTMIDAGLPLVQCLDILSKQQENKKDLNDPKKMNHTVMPRAWLKSNCIKSVIAFKHRW